MEQLAPPRRGVGPRPRVVAGRPSRRDRHRALRLRGDRVETVVRVFEDPRTGRRLHLLATQRPRRRPASPGGRGNRRSFAALERKWNAGMVRPG